jgi:hypothetical protein
VFFIYVSIEQKQPILKNWFLAFEKDFLGQKIQNFERDHFYRKMHHSPNDANFSILLLYFGFETIFFRFGIKN